MYGFESLIKSNRENFIILVSASRIIGIGILCISFYFLKKWVYFFCIVGGLTLILVLLFMKYAFESPHYIMTSTASADSLKSVLNKIASINEEDIITDKIAFSLSPQEA